MTLKKNSNFQSVILSAAAEDLRKAAKWYNKQAPDLGKKLIKRFRIRLRQLRQNPFVCQIRYSETHTALVEQFPYMIHYYIDLPNKTIVVLSILHTSRNPDLWHQTRIG